MEYSILVRKFLKRNADASTEKKFIIALESVTPCLPLRSVLTRLQPFGAFLFLLTLPNGLLNRNAIHLH